MEGTEVKIYRFKKDNLLCIIAAEDYEEAKMLAEKVFSDDPEGVKIYKRIKARVIYVEDLNEILSLSDMLDMLVQQIEKEKGAMN
jgi:uncharacterized protein related to proFAR isomerase